MFPLWGNSGLRRVLGHGYPFNPLGALGGGGCQGKLGSGLLPSWPQAPLGPSGLVLKYKNFSLTGPEVFGGLGAW